MSTETPTAEPRPRRLRGEIERWSLPVIFLATIGIFSAFRPEVFPTLGNFIAIVQQNLAMLVVVGALCFVLAMREYDLSFGFVAGAAGAISVQSMVLWQLPGYLAVALGIGLGLVLGLVNGLLVAFANLPSFIGTLATGAAVEGIMLAISNQTIFSGIAPDYLGLTSTKIGPLPVIIIVVAVLLVIFGFVLRSTVFGRHAAALGDNPVAAKVAGVPVNRVKVWGFVIVGGAAGFAGVLLTSQAGQYYPDAGSGLMLPAFAAAFLSLSLGRGWRFNVLGATIGALFLAVVSTGVTMLNQPSWVGRLLQGVILLVAILALNRRQATR